MKYQYIQQTAYEANMQLPQLDLVLFTFGNVSAVDRSLGVFAIKPSGVPYEELTPDKMVIVDFDHTVKENYALLQIQKHMRYYTGIGKTSVALYTHIQLMQPPGAVQRDIPIYGTTHADHNTVDIPCAPPMSDEMIKGNYEHETGFQIINCFTGKRIEL